MPDSPKDADCKKLNPVIFAASLGLSVVVIGIVVATGGVLPNAYGRKGNSWRATGILIIILFIVLGILLMLR